MIDVPPVQVLSRRVREVQGPWRVGLDLGEGRRLLADCTSGMVTPRSGGDTADCEVTLKDPELQQLISGQLDVRSAFMYGFAAVDGPMRPAVEFFDAIAGKDMDYYARVQARPRSTQDLAAAKQDLEELGYCLIEGALSQEKLEALRQRTDRQLAREAELGIGFHEGTMFDGSPGQPIQRLYGLMNKGQCYIDLLDEPLADEFLLERLGRDYQLSSYFVLSAGPGCSSQALHYDQCAVIPTIRNFVIGYNIVYFLDDFTEANGATRVLPASHLDANRMAPGDIYDVAGTVPAEGPAGTAFIFESRLWHGTGINRTDKARRGLFMYNVRSWMRATETWPMIVAPDVFATLTPQQRIRFGFKMTTGVGQVEYSRDGEMVEYRFDELIREL